MFLIINICMLQKLDNDHCQCQPFQAFNNFFLLRSYCSFVYCSLLKPKVALSFSILYIFSVSIISVTVSQPFIDLALFDLPNRTFTELQFVQYVINDALINILLCIFLHLRFPKNLFVRGRIIGAKSMIITKTLDINY